MEVFAASAHRSDPFTVAVDFDGVLCRPRWPSVGEEMPGAIEFLQWLAGQKCLRVLWSCREHGALDAALDWLAERGFPCAWWDAVNGNTAESIAVFGNDSRKCGCHVLLDDRAVGFPTDPADPEVPWWPAIREDIAARLAAWRGKQD